MPALFAADRVPLPHDPKAPQAGSQMVEKFEIRRPLRGPQWPRSPPPPPPPPRQSTLYPKSRIASRKSPSWETQRNCLRLSPPSMDFAYDRKGPPARDKMGSCLPPDTSKRSESLCRGTKRRILVLNLKKTSVQSCSTPPHFTSTDRTVIPANQEIPRSRITIAEIVTSSEFEPDNWWGRSGIHARSRLGCRSGIEMPP